MHIPQLKKNKKFIKLLIKKYKLKLVIKVIRVKVFKNKIKFIIIVDLKALINVILKIY